MIDSALEIREYIKTKFKNPRIYTEIKVVGDAQLAFNPLKVLGIIDLMVIDDDGNVEIFDYKCSPKSYSKFDTAKKRTFYH
jgi:RecB family exonuclease